MATPMRLKPIKVTTVPVTSGVKTLRARWMKRLRTISMGDPARQTPKMSASPDVPFPPWTPAARRGPRKAKLVPWMLRSPDPMGPNGRTWMKVATPETNKDMPTR